MSEEDQKPPVFEHWHSWYMLVLGVMLFQVILFSWLTYLFS
jgi:hypothetical protein